jgi:hypothetical protein
MKTLRAWMNKIFKLEEINGGEVCPTYLYRWTLFRLGPYALYLHHFVGSDWSNDLHDHPKRFISVGLRGSYIEHTPTDTRYWRAPWFRTFPATHIHRLETKDCWTLVLTLRNVRSWGFWNGGKWVHWKKYVGSENAWRARNCK